MSVMEDDFVPGAGVGAGCNVHPVPGAGAPRAGAEAEAGGSGGSEPAVPCAYACALINKTPRLEVAPRTAGEIFMVGRSFTG